MLNQKDIHKLAKQMYPASFYSRFERKQLSQSIAIDMQEYVEEHPDISYEALKEQFCDDELLLNQQEISSHHHLKFVIMTAALLILICFFVYCISTTWTPPTYSL